MGAMSVLNSPEAKTAIKDALDGVKIGDILREFVNKSTDGVFGNGAMKQREGESDADFKARQAAAVGAAVTAYQSRAMGDAPKTTDLLAAFKTGIISQKVKGYLLPAVIVLGGGYMAYPTIKKIFK
jgi:hypothetical protein